MAYIEFLVISLLCFCERNYKASFSD